MHMICPDCKVELIRRKSKFKNAYWWGCPNYPKCDISCSEDEKGKLIDYPAGKEIKGMRRKAHQLMEDVFGAWEDRKGSRAKMYGWLKYRVKSGHIGHATKKELVRVIKLLEKKI